MTFLPFAKRFFGGSTLEEAVAEAQRLNRQGLRVAFGYLGEEERNISAVQKNLSEYLRLIRTIAEHRVDASLSIKCTQLGLAVSESYGVDQLRKLLKEAAEPRVQVTLDMERSRWADSILRMYEILRSDFPLLGICVQARLYRTEKDIERILSGERPQIIHLCKGAYREGADIAYQDEEDVQRKYRHSLQILLEQAAKGNVILGVATHDPLLLEEAAAQAHIGLVPYETLELQMLYGVNHAFLGEQASRGIPVRVYLPYGNCRGRYLWRRLLERARKWRWHARRRWVN